MSRTGLDSSEATQRLERAGVREECPPASVNGAAARPAGRGEHRCESIRQALLDNLDPLYRFILVRVGHDRHRAEDVLQATAEAALRAGESPREIEQVEAWLRGVARNMVRRSWRDTAKRNGNVGRTVLDRLESSCPREALASRELSEALVRAIAQLSWEDQRLLYAFYRHGRSQAEIADELRCTPKGVEMKLYRMRARLREALASGDD